MKKPVEDGSILVQRNGPEIDRDGGLIRMACTLTSVTPLLQNSMSEEQLLTIRDKTKKPKMAARPTVRDEAKSKLYLLNDGRAHVPVKNLFACLIAAGQFVRLDARRQITNAKATVLPGMLTIETTELPLYVPGTEESATWEVDIQQGRNPNGGEAVCIVRPRFDQWEIRFVIEVDQNEMDLKMAYRLIEISGKRVGLCDGRPQRKGTFGRSCITSWSPLGTEDIEQD